MPAACRTNPRASAPRGFFFALRCSHRQPAPAAGPRGLPMNTEYLESFAKVVECRSLAEAARRLHLTSGAVAARLRLLDSELAPPRVQRSGQTSTHTEAARRIAWQGGR